ncbi:RNA-directed DNA polymerase from mobile element jockey-like protein [Elysia marginata]|uniref:RNA-directed DNA polymerase from mobile element jockey-like protein n=1 Tax=Elysia marginata TaxID=1093978 RepID=A0AAV4IES1_9GAST|nr:RNA-directed DNA polymerase from mobile element jockey-like protein [Elysia marginata]
MNVKAKVAARNSLLRKLANSNWGADPKTLRTTALALSYSTAEYSSAVWARSCHAKKVDAELNNACRIVTGQLRPTPLPLLYRTAGIAPSDIRRQTHGSTEKLKQEDTLCLTTAIPEPDSKLEGNGSSLHKPSPPPGLCPPFTLPLHASTPRLPASPNNMPV